jgi:aromatic-amino-acid transaminase
LPKIMSDCRYEHFTPHPDRRSRAAKFHSAPWQANMSANKGRLMFDKLALQSPDALLQIIKDHAGDSRAHKIDVGVGVYRDEAGVTPVFGAVKAAEAWLVQQQDSKSYLGADGDTGFVALLGELIFGEAYSAHSGLGGVQTPGGTGALRLGAELLNRARPGATIWQWTPTWPNHPPIIKESGLHVQSIPAYDVPTAMLDMGAVAAALTHATAGDILLVQASCHNPTGADPNPEQWARIAQICAERGLIPFIDCAYQGLGDGLDEDVEGLRTLVAAVDEAVIAYSCDKNFGLYRDRVGALWVKSEAQTVAAVRSNMLELTRSLWSMPPDHGAAVVRLVLEDKALKAAWQQELDAMRERINSVRKAVAMTDPRLDFIARHRGLFAMLPLTADQIAALRKEHAIYMAPSGRFNVAGLALAQVPIFVDALQSVL